MIDEKKFLVIDDDPDIREIYRQILEPKPLNHSSSKSRSLFEGLEISREHLTDEYYELTLLENGEKGIEAVKESLKNRKPYIGAFVDLKLPGLNGAETIEWIWKIDPNIKIVIVTAYSQYLCGDCSMVDGRDDLFYLRKPFNPDEIRQFARAFTKQWKLEREKETLTEDLKAAHEKLEDMNNNLQKKVEEQTTMLIQSDKMASIGLLAAGIAHEINNPIAFLNNNLSSLKTYSFHIKNLLQKYNELENCVENGTEENPSQLVKEIRDLWNKNKMDFIFDDIVELIDDSLEGTERVSNIVRDLKSFSRIKEEDIDYVNLNDVIDTVINIIWNELKYKIKIIKDYGELPPVKCIVQKMSQVFMNILTNASQAIKKKGKITIITKHIRHGKNVKNDCIEVRIVDDGIGIPKENMTKIFDPFFSTKQDSGGTGLGLKITYDIIKAHRGEIKVESEVGKGSTFIIKIPLNQEINAI